MPEPVKNSSQTIWGQVQPDHDQRRQLLESMKANFPECTSAIERSLLCSQYHHNEKYDRCHEYNDILTFCIVYSYCPKQAEDYANCLKSFQKPVQFKQYPRGCSSHFGRLDKCMKAHQI